MSSAQTQTGPDSEMSEPAISVEMKKRPTKYTAPASSGNQIIAAHEEALDYLIAMLRPDIPATKPPSGFRAVIRPSVKADGERPYVRCGSLTLSVLDHRGRELDRTRHWLTRDAAARVIRHFRFEPEQTERVWPEPKFRGVCPSCGEVSLANRRGKCSCIKCSPTFDERFLLVWTRNTTEVS